MALRPEYSLGHSEFNEFLFAFVGEEENGIQLTVLSALARLGFEPWTEAARLADMTKEAATSALMAAISALPEGDWKKTDSRSIAVRLVKCLPKRGTARAGSPSARRIKDQKPKWGIQRWMICVAIAAAVIMVISRLYGDKVSETDVGSVWSKTQHLAGVASIGMVPPHIPHRPREERKARPAMRA